MEVGMDVVKYVTEVSDTHSVDTEPINQSVSHLFD